MKIWIIAVMIGLLLFAGLVVANAVVKGEQIEEPSVKKSCGQLCGNSCSSTSNCGQESCGARNGGSCGCQ